MAGGARGAEKTFAILESQMIRTLKLLGVNSIAELNPDTVRYLAERKSM
jgi:isopentenyl diphosphate isomerase/L-lactate dehydrogenase-like FMN-dependent dehydrogenase